MGQTNSRPGRTIAPMLLAASTSLIAAVAIIAAVMGWSAARAAEARAAKAESDMQAMVAQKVADIEKMIAAEEEKARRASN